MKSLILISFFSMGWFGCQDHTIFELAPNQSMSIVGKGQGQDAAINPFSGEDSKAIVANLGNNKFAVRVQEQGEIIYTTELNPDRIVEVELYDGYELYLDTIEKGKAKVVFKKLNS
ncbi:MAG: hypothetical protein JXQ87_01180 [Bacteroidia bacterium]